MTSFAGELNPEIIHGFKRVLWQFLSGRRTFPRLLEWTNQQWIILKFYCNSFTPQLSLLNSTAIYTHFFLSNCIVILSGPILSFFCLSTLLLTLNNLVWIHHIFLTLLNVLKKKNSHTHCDRQTDRQTEWVRMVLQILHNKIWTQNLYKHTHTHTHTHTLTWFIQKLNNFYKIRNQSQSPDKQKFHHCNSCTSSSSSSWL